MKVRGIEEILSYAEGFRGDPKSLQRLLRGVSVAVLEGRLERSILTGLAYAAGPILRTWEAADLDKRLRALEGKSDS